MVFLKKIFTTNAQCELCVNHLCSECVLLKKNNMHLSSSEADIKF